MRRRKLANNYARDLVVNSLASSALVPVPLRWRLLRLLRFRGIERSSIAVGCFFGSAKVSIGRGTSIGPSCFFDGLDRVTIGQDCDIAMQALFVTSSHETGPASRRGGASITSPVTIGNGVWVGARVTVLPGVSVGDGCIIGAGAVVTTDCEPNGLYAGTPARLVRKL